MTGETDVERISLERRDGARAFWRKRRNCPVAVALENAAYV
jgi:hypothetical protein